MRKFSIGAWTIAGKSRDPFLRGIQQHALRDLLAARARAQETSRAADPGASDAKTPGTRGDVQRLGYDPPRYRREELQQTHRRDAASSRATTARRHRDGRGSFSVHPDHQSFQFCRRRRINQYGGRVLFVEELEQPGIEDGIAPDNQDVLGIVRPDFGNLLHVDGTGGARADIDRNLGAIRRGLREVLREKVRRGGEDDRFRQAETLQLAQKTFEQRNAAQLGQRTRTVGEDDTFMTHRSFLNNRRCLGKPRSFLSGIRVRVTPPVFRGSLPMSRHIFSRFRYSPFLAQMVVIRRCNLSCGYCSEFDKTSDPVPVRDPRKTSRKTEGHLALSASRSPAASRPCIRIFRA